MVIGQRVLPNAGHGDDVGIWEGSIVYEVLYFVLEVETIVGFIVKFLVEVAIFIRVLSGMYEIGYRCGI